MGSVETLVRLVEGLMPLLANQTLDDAGEKIKTDILRYLPSVEEYLTECWDDPVGASTTAVLEVLTLELQDLGRSIMKCRQRLLVEILNPPEGGVDVQRHQAIATFLSDLEKRYENNLAHTKEIYALLEDCISEDA